MTHTGLDPAIRLLDCPATLAGPRGTSYCTLVGDHGDFHESWPCSCAGDGRCSHQQQLVEVWVS